MLYIFDAKYKISGRNNQKPSKGEEYQMFAYSHLITKHQEQLFEQPTRHVGLVYPTFNATSKVRTRVVVLSQKRASHPIRILSQFYQPKDVQDAQSWKDCMNKIGTAWKNELPTTEDQQPANSPTASEPTLTPTLRPMIQPRHRTT